MIWTSIEGLFCNNKKIRILALEAEFRGTAQGDLPVLQYYQKMKSLVDALGALDHAISDETLVLTILRGLTKRFSMISIIIATKTPFPDFLEVRTLLQMNEASHTKKVAAPNTLYSSTGNPSAPHTYNYSTKSNNNGGSRGGKYKPKPKKAGGDGGGSPNGNNYQGVSVPFFNPMTGTF
ncbi:uncharacterized protein LOC120278447 [Dioscorea cayenensis subsp. rotundata]|uniref:Uncharacterized protein LOC120278447 n=1 Tax=Dioscorea cayennensis subsp. rotundata TaxID=55577 RepID=A0AB40CP88_DIOCR|nr:uncharacterized protein LOC120278447 [Dioscorea cayenensis subsp. rotundata]